MAKISFIYYGSATSFIEGDRKLLSKEFDVSDCPFKSILDLPNMIKSIRGSDLSYTWFVDGHAFLAVLISKLLGKKSVVVAGGYDVACETDIGYGLYATRSRLKQALARFALRRADAVLAVSDFTKKEVLKQAEPNYMDTVYNGVDIFKFRPLLTVQKENLVITVGAINELTLKRKGFKTFVDVANLFPDVRFVIIGGYDDTIKQLEQQAPDNVTFTGRVSDEELIDWYRRARVYCQLSAYESFGVAVVEAMSCRCIPVVTDCGALSEVVGDCGVFTKYGDAEDAARSIACALELSENVFARILPRSRVWNFTSARRKEHLVKVINNLIVPH